MPTETERGPFWLGPCPVHEHYEKVCALTIHWIEADELNDTDVDTEEIDADPPHPVPEGVLLGCGEEVALDDLPSVTDEWDVEEWDPEDNEPVDPQAAKGPDGEWYTTIREGSDGSGRWA